MKNIEIKFRISAQQEVFSRLQQHPDIKFLWSQEQTDIYFPVNQGRLKLRLQSDSDSQLIYYQRKNSLIPRPSEYQIYKTTEPTSLKKILEKTLGIKTVVRKTRNLFRYRNVRIHLDEVTDLGNFLEFESVLEEGMDEKTAEQNLQQLLEILSFIPLTPIAESYADLMNGNC